MQTRILLVDDYQIVREGVRLMLLKEAGFEVVGVADNGADAVEKARTLVPDLVLMDIDLGDMSGIEASRQILGFAPQTRILMLSGMVDAQVVNEGIAAGVNGFILKTNAADELIRAIRVVMDGYSYLCREMSDFVVNNYKQILARRATPDKKVLTERETEVLRLTAEGLRMKDIANRLNIGVKTVETHRSNLMKKLVCGSSAELTRYAIREGICPV